MKCGHKGLTVRLTSVGTGLVECVVRRDWGRHLRPLSVWMSGGEGGGLSSPQCETGPTTASPGPRLAGRLWFRELDKLISHIPPSTSLSQLPSPWPPAQAPSGLRPPTCLQAPCLRGPVSSLGRHFPVGPGHSTVPPLLQSPRGLSPFRCQHRQCCGCGGSAASLTPLQPPVQLITESLVC